MSKKKPKRNCTIHTDASYRQEDNLAQSACHCEWKTQNGLQIAEYVSDPFIAKDSLDAELTGVYNALCFMSTSDRNEFTIYCDNIAVVNLLDASNGVIPRSIISNHTIMEDLKTLIEGNGYIIHTKHVKGHDTKSRSKITTLNNKVHNLSREYLKDKTRWKKRKNLEI